MSAGPDLRPSHDWQKVVLFVIAVVGAVYTVGDKVLALGRTTASVEKIERIESAQNQMGVDLVRAKLQAEGANAAALRVEEKVDKQDAKLDHINDVLMQIRITGRR